MGERFQIILCGSCTITYWLLTNFPGQLENDYCSHTYDAADDEVGEEIVAEVGHSKGDPVVSQCNCYKSCETGVRSDICETIDDSKSSEPVELVNPKRNNMDSWYF